MLEDCDSAANHTHRWECWGGADTGECRPTRDHAGLTMHGITQRDYPDKFKDGLPTVADFQDVYREAFWRPLRCDQMPWPVSLAVADFAFNSGHRRALQVLQHVLVELGATLRVDGKIGPKTIAALTEVAAKHTPRVVARGICAWRTEFLLDLSERPGMDKFRKGWLRRVSALETKIG
jgi:lysozyme family protein